MKKVFGPDFRRSRPAQKTDDRARSLHTVLAVLNRAGVLGAVVLIVAGWILRLCAQVFPWSQGQAILLLPTHLERYGILLVLVLPSLNQSVVLWILARRGQGVLAGLVCVTLGLVLLLVARAVTGHGPG